MTEGTITAHLSDGRYVEVPQSAALDWAAETAELDTTLGLADWYTDQGDEHQDKIQGDIIDEPRCTHLFTFDSPHELSRVRVVNGSQADAFDISRTHASVWVCGARACVLDAMAWAERATNEPAVWIDDAGVKHTLPPLSDITTGSVLAYPLDQAAAEAYATDDVATFTIALDKREFLFVLANSDPFTDLSVEDFVHDRVLSFGVTYGGSVELIAIDGEYVTVEYTTNVAEALNMARED